MDLSGRLVLPKDLADGHVSAWGEERDQDGSERKQL